MSKTTIIEAIEAAWLYPSSRHATGREPVGFGYDRLPEATKAALRSMKSDDIANVRTDRFLPSAARH